MYTVSPCSQSKHGCLKEVDVYKILYSFLFKSLLVCIPSGPYISNIHFLFLPYPFPIRVPYLFPLLILSIPISYPSLPYPFPLLTVSISHSYPIFSPYLPYPFPLLTPPYPIHSPFLPNPFTLLTKFIHLSNPISSPFILKTNHSALLSQYIHISYPIHSLFLPFHSLFLPYLFTHLTVSIHPSYRIHSPF